jgi:thymidine kinase
MPPLILQAAVKTLKPLKVLSYGPTYSGKTLSSLYLAVGLVMKIRNCTEAEAYKHIVLIDTEFGRGALYNKIGLYNYLRIDPPYYTEKLVDLIEQLNNMPEVDVIVADSLTHFWVKEGGILDQKAAKDKMGGNSYTNWQDFTAKFNKMIDTILASPKHIFATARAKTDTALVTGENGKATPKSYGLKPELRDNVEYDFDIVFNIDKQSHNLIVDKGVPGLKPLYEIATPEIGQQIYGLFNADAVVPKRTKKDIADDIRSVAKANNMIPFVQLELRGRKLEDIEESELLSLETNLINQVKKSQIKK